MKIYLGTDHAGFNLKEKLIPFLKSLGHSVIDKGAFSYNKNDDYPDYIKPVAKAVSRNVKNRGIILGASGQGEAIVANRFKGIRAAVYYGGSEKIVKLSRMHNNANILSLGARFLTEQQAKKAVSLWLSTAFSKDKRHEMRIKKIDSR